MESKEKEETEETSEMQNSVHKWKMLFAFQ
jgi:hypothetical protein